MVDLIHDKLGGTTYTGRMNAKEKEKSKEKFLLDPDCRVFISSDAGGYGVDLPNANLLINYDLPWSAGLTMQRNGRIKRASSRWPSVTIQDMLIEGSIEERQHEMLLTKYGLTGNDPYRFVIYERAFPLSGDLNAALVEARVRASALVPPTANQSCRANAAS